MASDLHCEMAWDTVIDRILWWRYCCCYRLSLIVAGQALISTGRNLVEASALVQRYIGSPHTPDDPSSSEVERLLKASGKRDVSASGASSRGTDS